MRSSSKKTVAKNQKSNESLVNITLAFKLFDWSETLTFDQIMDTLFVIGQFINNEKHPMFTEKDIKIIKAWLSKNSIDQFLQAKETALLAYENELNKELFAKEIMSTPYKHSRSH